MGYVFIERLVGWVQWPMLWCTYKCFPDCKVGPYRSKATVQIMWATILSALHPETHREHISMHLSLSQQWQPGLLYYQSENVKSIFSCLKIALHWCSSNKCYILPWKKTSIPSSSVVNTDAPDPLIIQIHRVASNTHHSITKHSL